MLARLLRPAAVALAAALWLTAPPPAHAELQDILNAGVVRIGVPVDVPPFGFVDAQQQPAGLDIEMAKLVAKELGVKLEMQQITGANRIPYLMTNKVDLVISAMGATPERARQVAFSSPYAALFIGLFGPADAKVGGTRRDRRQDRGRGPRHDPGHRADGAGARCQDHALRRRRHGGSSLSLRPGRPARHRQRDGQGACPSSIPTRRWPRSSSSASRPVTSASGRATPTCCAGSTPSSSTRRSTGR